MELASDEDSTLFICLLDYEKAFDFTNRSVRASNMMNYGIGDKFLLNFFNSNINTYYIPKDEDNRVGERIHTKHGVTQGKTSSAGLFSFYVSDMSEAVDNSPDDDLPYDLLQLADDTTILSNSLLSLSRKIYNI